MTDNEWSLDKLTRLEHYLMRGDLSFKELAELFGVSKSNLFGIIRRYNIDIEPVHHKYSHKERNIIKQLRCFYDKVPDNILTPSKCPMTGLRLTYDIHSSKPNSAIVLLNEDNSYIVVAKEYTDG